VKLLLDENLSRRFVDRLADLFPGSTHAALAGLLQSPDTAIWEYAKAGDYSIVTADADFYELATTFGPPPKVIWLRGCDYPTAVAERLIRGQAIRVTEFLEDPDRAVLILVP
jgi:predicted nuclease of predicted toxin-antitoxin system